MGTRDRKKAVVRGDPMLEHRRRFKAVLDALGVRALFEAMPAYVRDQMIRRRDPEATLAFDAACPTDAEFVAFRATLTRAFASATLTFESGASMRVADFCSILPTLAAVNVDAPIGVRMPPACARFVEAVRPVAAAWLKRAQDAWLAWHEPVIVPLVERSRLDGRLYYASLHGERMPTGGQRITLRVHAEPARAARATLDGESRPIYRVGTTNTWDKIQWTTWADDDGGQALPVYAQSHALRQLRTRVDLPTYAAWLEHWLHESLTRPTIVERWPNGDVLVAYCVDGSRLGYLVVTPLADRVVVRTFLFLTMAPSPEARQLEQQLRLRRGDVNWLGLHELSAFTRSDLVDDDTLRPMLDACGCGHLFDLADFDPAPRALAETMRQYLRLAA